MTDTPSNPEPAPAEAPTAPLPPVDVPPAATQAPTPTWTVPGESPMGPHAPHRASEGAIAAMVIGSLLFAMLAFGAGWTVRGVAQRVQFAHGSAMMGQPFGGGQGFSGGPGSYGGPGAQGFGRGSGRGFHHGLGLRGRMGMTPNGQTPSLPGQPPNVPQGPPQSVPASPTR
jgi:hypothetical protein